MIYFTSDEHYGHDFIRTYYNRPFKTSSEMDMTIIDRHNERVKEGDTVYHIGDFYDELEAPKDRPCSYYTKQLNGNHIYFEGNHVGDPAPAIKSYIIEPGDKRIFMTHVPADIDLNFKLCFVGHVHNKWEIWRHDDYVLVNVGVDVWNYYPTTLEEIMARVNTRTGKVKNALPKM